MGHHLPRDHRRPAIGRFAALLLALILILLQGSLAAAQEGYLIRAGDTLRIEVIEDNSINRTVLVPPDGRISVPLAGAVTAAGRTVEQVQTSLTDQLAPNFATRPNVFVAIERIVEPRATAPQAPAAPAVAAIFVLGEVNNPGRLDVEPGTTVLQLFAQMGGFTRFAATRRIQLRRADAAGVEQIYTLDYEAILDGRSPNGTAVLVEGDVIVVPERRLFE